MMQKKLLKLYFTKISDIKISESGKDMSTVNLLINMWRYYEIMKNTMNVVKGVGAGLVAGAVVGYVGSQMAKNPKQTKKKAKKAVGAVSGMLDNVQAMLK